MPHLLTTGAAAARLRITRQTLYRLVAAGELRALRLGPGPRAHYRIESDELARFLRRHDRDSGTVLLRAARAPTWAPGTASSGSRGPGASGADETTRGEAA